MTIGMVLLGVQLLYLSQLGADAGFWNLFPGFVIGGLGMAMAMTPTAAVARACRCTRPASARPC